MITAQIVASYGSILVDFGFKSVSAKHVSIHRENKAKLSEIVSSILTIRFFLWLCRLSGRYCRLVCAILARRIVPVFLFSAAFP